MERHEQLKLASQAAARARTLAKMRRWAEQMRAAGWIVIEPK